MREVRPQSSPSALKQHGKIEVRRCIIVVHLNYLANAISPLARQLRDDHDIDMVLVCYRRGVLPKPGVHNFEPSDFREIVELDPLFVPNPDITGNDLGKLADEATAIERDYGVNLTELIRTDRMLAMGFVNGAWFPDSIYGRTLTYPHTVDIATRLWRYFEDLVDRLQPMAVMNVSSALGPASLWHLVRARGVPVRNLVLARSGKGLFWTDEQAMRPRGFEAAYARELAKELISAQAENEEGNAQMEPSYRARAVMGDFAKQSTVRHLVHRFHRIVRRRIGRSIFRRQDVYGGYLMSHQFKLVFNRWRWRRAALRAASIVEGLPADTPFVFYPLQIEPESTLMFESQMCDNQLSAIDWLAKTLPGGWLLVVKEHPGATAPRPAGFNEQLERYPNVVVASVLEDSELIVERAKAVAVLNGSVGLQAASIGKPVITFHPFFIATLLDHVMLARSYEETRSALARIRDDELPSRAERLRQAGALRRALDECQFPISTEQILSGVPTRETVVPADIDAIATTFLESVGTRATTALDHDTQYLAG